MPLLTDLTDDTPQAGIHATQHNLVNAAITAEIARATAAELTRWNTRGTWVTATAYAINDIVDGPIGFSGGLYRCITAHTSGGSFTGPGVNWETVRDANGTSVPMPTGSPSVGDVPTVTDASPLALDWAASGGGGSASVAGVQVTHKFPFAFNTPNLLTGATAVFTDGYTPAVGDILYDAWIEIDTAWNGTTPLADIGTFTGDIYGWLASLYAAADMSLADDSVSASPEVLMTHPAGLLAAGVLSDVTSYIRVSGAGPSLGTYVGNLSSRQLPGKFTSAVPIKICVSQDGTITGADPGSTQGAAILYVVTSTPGGSSQSSPSVHTRELLSGNPVSIVNASDGFLTWDTVVSGDLLLDRSTLNRPTIVTAGVYAISVSVQPNAITNGGFFVVTLGIDLNGDNAQANSNSPPSVAGYSSMDGLSLTYYAPAGAVIYVDVTNLDGSATRQFSLASAVVQRVS